MKNKIISLFKTDKPGKIINLVEEQSPYAELLIYYLKEYSNLDPEDKNIIRNFFKIHNEIIKHD